MSTSRPANDDTFVEPSWMTAAAETDAVVRRLRQATTSAERLSKELAALREWSDETARLDLARALTEGPDGGVLSLLATVASDQESDPAVRRTVDSLLDRLASSLGLQPIAERGEHLRLLPEDLGEFEIRGTPGNAAPRGTRELFRVIRPGWWLGNRIIARPLLEPVAGETSSRATPEAVPRELERRDA